MTFGTDIGFLCIFLKSEKTPLKQKNRTAIFAAILKMMAKAW